MIVVPTLTAVAGAAWASAWSARRIGRPRASELVHNEQTKLRATLYNTMAAGLIVAGIVTPIVASLRAEGAVVKASLLPAVIWFLLAGVLHYAGTLFLERLG